MPDSLYDIWSPYTTAANHTKKVIIAKLQAEKYARSDAIGASTLDEKWTKIASEREEELYTWFFKMCYCYYSKDRNGIYVRTVQDKVTEVTSKEELDARLSSCVNYANNPSRLSVMLICEIGHRVSLSYLV